MEYYNTTESLDGQWYAFIVDGDGYTIAHHNPMFLGAGPKPSSGRQPAIFTATTCLEAY